MTFSSSDRQEKHLGGNKYLFGLNSLTRMGRANISISRDLWHFVSCIIKTDLRKTFVYLFCTRVRTLYSEPQLSGAIVFPRVYV